MNFKEKLEKIVKKNNSLLCVGLDIDKGKLPDFLLKSNEDPYLEFNKQIIESTKDLVCAYKLNMAFYETLGLEGIKLLDGTIKMIPGDIIVILDGKRNDIGNTAKKYAESLYETLGCDSVTLKPYMGIDSVKPFLEYQDKCSFILCRTSNPSAVDIQDLKVKDKPIYQHVAEKIKEWDDIGCCGVVVGATYPEELQTIRKILGEDILLLIPGVGKQGGDVEKTIKYGCNKDGEMAIINSSRGIIYAGSDEDFAEKARFEALKLRDLINKYR